MIKSALCTIASQVLRYFGYETALQYLSRTYVNRAVDLYNSETGDFIAAALVDTVRQLDKRSNTAGVDSRYCLLVRTELSRRRTRIPVSMLNRDAGGRLFAQI